MARFASLLATLLLALPAAAGHHEGAASAPMEDATPSAATGPLDPDLDGRAIYRRVLDNTLRSSYSEQRLHSVDPGGYEQELHFWSRFRDYREEGQPRDDGVISKSVLKFTAPFDKRESGYLFVERHREQNDGFHYLKQREKVMRINTSKETIFGSDYTLEDIAMARMLDDATYERREDAEKQGRPVYQIMVFHEPEADPQYSKSLLFVDPETWVPLESVHWNHDDVEAKRLTAPFERIEQHAGVWIPMHTRMDDLLEGTWSELHVDRLDANVELADRYFNPKRLARLQ